MGFCHYGISLYDKDVLPSFEHIGDSLVNRSKTNIPVKILNDYEKLIIRIRL